MDVPVWSNLLLGFGIVFTLQNLGWLFIGVLLGTIVGVMPGLGSLSTMAILLPVTFGMDPVGAVIMLTGIHYGSSYGGSTTAILVNIPGEGSSVMTCMDGYPMAKQGRAKAALATSAIGSFFAGTVAAVLLMFLAEPISALGMKFGPPEYFAIMFLALTMVGSLSTEAPLKGMFMALVGLFLATVGIERQTGQVRFTFGADDLTDGINFIVVAIGMFGVTVVMSESERIKKFGFKPPRDQIKGVGLWITWNELKQSFMPYVRGSLLGFGTGVLPGLGGMTATLLAYGVEKQVSKHPEQFGKGAIEGVATVEAANNAANGANLVPLMTLGIPGNASTALLLGAFIMYGLKPGPMLMETNPEFFWAVVASLYIGNVMLLILNLPLVNIFAKLLDVPEALLNGLVLALCVLGVYTRESLMTDVYLMIAFGVIGYFAEKHKYPVAPLLLGLVLGNLVEQALLRSMSISNGDPTIFFTRPIALVIMIAAGLSLAYSLRKFYWRRVPDPVAVTAGNNPTGQTIPWFGSRAPDPDDSDQHRSYPRRPPGAEAQHPHGDWTACLADMYSEPADRLRCGLVVAAESSRAEIARVRRVDIRRRPHCVSMVRKTRNGGCAHDPGPGRLCAAAGSGGLSHMHHAARALSNACDPEGSLGPQCCHGGDIQPLALFRYDEAPRGQAA